MNTIVGSIVVAGLLAVLLTEGAHSEEPKPTLTSQLFGDWVYRCQPATEEGKPARSICEVAQEMVVRKDDKPLPVLTMAFSHGTDGKSSVINVLAPLGVLLKPGLAVAADSGKPIAFEFSHCDARGCWVSAQKADAAIAALKAGKAGHARMVMVNGHNLTIDFSLSGLVPALAAFDSGKPPVDNLASAPPAKPAAQ
jgi:invasion protein IalB